MGETFAELARGGPILFAVGAAALAGLVSFLSPCVLPLVPGYLSYVTGLTGADLESRAATTPLPASQDPGASSAAVAVAAPAVTPRWGRVVAGTALFIAGFTVVFTLYAVLLAQVGVALNRHQRALEVVVGALIILLGLAFAGLIPGLEREFRIHRLPAAGLFGAPIFGAIFALSWTPCVGPTLGAVMGLATVTGETDRAVVLAVAYCLGLGLPFVVFGLGFSRLLGLFRAVRRNSRWVTRTGGVLLTLVGLALVTGGWNNFIIWLLTNVGVGEVLL